MSQPDPDKVARLKQALEAFEASGGQSQLFDHAGEEALAPVRKRALGLLDQRSRSRHELRERLLKAEYAPEAVDAVLDSLQQAGLIDDGVFAHEWVRQRAARRGKSARALDRELKEKGVGAADRADALEQISAEDEAKAARALAEKKAREVKTPPADRAEYDKYLRRIVGVMARRGYGSGMALSIGREVLDARIEEVGE